MRCTIFKLVTRGDAFYVHLFHMFLSRRDWGNIISIRRNQWLVLYILYYLVQYHLLLSHSTCHGLYSYGYIIKSWSFLRQAFSYILYSFMNEWVRWMNGTPRGIANNTCNMIVRRSTTMQEVTTCNNWPHSTHQYSSFPHPLYIYNIRTSPLLFHVSQPISHTFISEECRCIII